MRWHFWWSDRSGCAIWQITPPSRHDGCYLQTHSLHPEALSSLRSSSGDQVHSGRSCWSDFPFLFVQSIQGKMVWQAAWSHPFLKTKNNKRWKTVSSISETFNKYIHLQMGFSLCVSGFSLDKDCYENLVKTTGKCTNAHSKCFSWNFRGFTGPLKYMQIFPHGPLFLGGEIWVR